MMNWGRFAILLAAACIVGVLATKARNAEAAIITYDFTAEANFISPSLGPTLSRGQTLTGSLSFDDATTGTVGSPTRATYFDAVTALSVSVAGLTWTLNPSGPNNRIEITNNLPVTPPADFFVALASISGPQVNGRVPDRVSFVLSDNTGTRLNSLDLPTDLDLADFPGLNTRVVLFFDINVSNFFTFTSLQRRPTDPAAVAEPGGLAILLVGAFLVTAASFGSRRRLRRVASTAAPSGALPI